MSVEKMTMVTLSGPAEQVDLAIQSFVVNRDFHPENAAGVMSKIRRLTPFDSVSPYSGLLARAYALCAAMELKPEYRDFSGVDFTIENTGEYIDSISEHIENLTRELAGARQKAVDCEDLATQLHHVSGVNENLDALLQMKYVKFRFGRLPEELYEECLETIKARSDAFYFRTGPDESGSHVYGMYFALPSVSDQIDSIFASMQFERIRLDKRIVGTADEAIEKLRGDAQEARSRAGELENELSALKEDEKERFFARYSFVRFMSESFELRSVAGHRRGKFYITGWVPSSIAEEYAGEAGSVPEFSCVLAEAGDVRERPPVLMRGGLLSRIYEPFVKMYGLPAYGEIDPRFFMAVTYTLLFGVMYGDVGQGAVLILIGFLMWRFKKMWLGRILCLCGCSSAVFGFVYGSIFGFEHILPGFKVLEGGNTMSILIIAVVAGVALLLVCMILNMINGIRSKDIGRIFFSPNGLAAFVMYLSIAVGAVMLFLAGKNIFTAPYVIGLIVLPLLLMFAKEPLTKLATGRKDWKPHSIGMFFVESFFEMFETILSYVSNTVSFLRVGAFAISHAGMMMVVFLLSEGANGGYSPFGLVLGNLLVMGIEAVLVCIQVMRLEFYEMFGRFYGQSGEAFSPRIIDYSKITT